MNTADQIQFPVRTGFNDNPSTPIITVDALELHELIEAKMVAITPIHYGSSQKPEGYGDEQMPREAIMGFLQRRSKRLRADRPKVGS